MEREAYKGREEGEKLNSFYSIYWRATFRNTKYFTDTKR